MVGKWPPDLLWFHHFPVYQRTEMPSDVAVTHYFVVSVEIQTVYICSCAIFTCSWVYVLGPLTGFVLIGRRAGWPGPAMPSLAPACYMGAQPLWSVASNPARTIPLLLADAGGQAISHTQACGLMFTPTSWSVSCLGAISLRFFYWWNLAFLPFFISQVKSLNANTPTANSPNVK